MASTVSEFRGGGNKTPSPGATRTSKVLNPTDPITELVFFGKKMESNALANLMRANMDGSLDLVTQIQMDIFDPEFALLNTGVYEPKLPVRLDGYMFQIASLSTTETSGHESFTIKCRPRAIHLLKNRTGKKVYSNVSPSEFVERECKAVGIKAVTQKSARRKQIKRDVKSPKEKGDTNKKPSSFTTFQRLASECGFVFYEWGNVVYFGKPTWFLEQEKGKEFHIHWGDGAPGGSWRPISVPKCEKNDDTKIVTVNFEVPISAWKSVRVGGAVKLSGMSGFNGVYIIKSLNYDLAGASVISIEAGTPENPEKVKPIRVGGGGAGGGDGDTPWTGPGGTEPQTGTGSITSIVNTMLGQAGKTYIFGAEANPTDSSPSAFDCSELIEWACARNGVFMPDGSAAQYGYCTSKGLGMSLADGVRTYGAILYRSGHIAVSLGNGETIEAVGTGYGVRKMNAVGRSNPFTAAARIPGARY